MCCQFDGGYKKDTRTRPAKAAIGWHISAAWQLNQFGQPDFKNVAELGTLVPACSSMVSEIILVIESTAAIECFLPPWAMSRLQPLAYE